MMVEAAERKTSHSESAQNCQMISSDNDLRRLAKAVGVECDYVDGREQRHQATDDDIHSILRALGIHVVSDADIHREWVCIQEKQWTQVIEPVLLHYVEARTPLCFTLALPLGNEAFETISLQCGLKDEQGKIRSFRVKGSSCVLLEENQIRGLRYVRIQVNVPERLRLGYYELLLAISLGSRLLEVQSFVIAAPRRCYLPRQSKKAWGIGVQLYGVRSRDNWGIGDFRDLARIIKGAGKTLKASTIGLQPLHSLTRGLRSPYSPSSRVCWNPLYLDLEQVAEFRASPKVQRMVKTKKFQNLLQALRSTRLVEYDAVEHLKMSVLEDLYRVFKQRHLKPKTRRARTFLQFLEQCPSYVTNFCTYQALCEKFDRTSWRQWPSEFQDPASPAVEQFRKECADRLQLFHYVQWLCELQLTRLDRVAEQSSLYLGLYHDLPVGVHPDGADAWNFQEQLGRDATIGAPPDSFNLQGQNWGLLAPNPHTLRQHRYEFFRHTVSQNMRHGGVLRIDHALGLFRMFWVPFGKNGRDGLYVKTYVDELLAILAIESVRHRVMVVGEDLGTVTPAIRQKLQDAGLLSYRLLFFERENSGAFLAPAHFPSQALAAVTTHDLPTLKGYWAGRDIEVKAKANLYPMLEDQTSDLEARKADRHKLWEALHRNGLIRSSTAPSNLSFEKMKLVYQYLAQVPSHLLMVQLEDLLGELDTPNLPGASDVAYPSWRLKVNRELTKWLKDSEVKDFAQVISKERRRRGSVLKQSCALSSC